MDSDVFATEEEAIAAGTAAACNPNGSVGATICSCTLTATPAPVPLAWAYGIERVRGPGGFGRADYVLADEPHTGNCALGVGTWQWSFEWSVWGFRTIECPAGYYPDDHDPPETCWRPDPCPVPAVKPYNQDPYPLDVDNLADNMKQGLSCLEAATGKSRTELVSSAYRPPEYQAHLREVWDKWKDLENNRNPACAARRAEVKAEFDRHQLGASELRPSANPNNCHSRSPASCFDVNGRFAEDVDFNQDRCRIYRPYPVKDPVHVTGW